MVWKRNLHISCCSQHTIEPWPSGWQGSPCVWRYGREGVVSKPAISLTKYWGSYRRTTQWTLLQRHYYWLTTSTIERPTSSRHNWFWRMISTTIRYIAPARHSASVNFSMHARKDEEHNKEGETKHKIRTDVMHVLYLSSHRVNLS